MGGPGPDEGSAWPPLPHDEWQETLATLHMWTQIVGKTKLALAPWLNEWWQVALFVDVRGLTTGPMPDGTRTLQIDFDFVNHDLELRTAEGAVQTLPLRPQSVAAFYKAYLATLAELRVTVALNPLPTEIVDPVAFDVDVTHDAYDPGAVNRWWRVLVSTERVLQRWRSPFVGKSSPVNFFWGSFDLNATRFSGRPATLPEGAPRFLQLAEDQENVACGFWPGNATMSGIVLGEPAFYAYIYPEPPGFPTASIPPPAAYEPRFGQFLLRYADVQQASDPDSMVLTFFQSVYERAADLAGWDRTTLEQPVP